MTKNRGICIKIKEHIKCIIKGIPGCYLFCLLYRRIKDGNNCRRDIWYFVKPANLFQPYGTTDYQRYPRMFHFVREHIGSDINNRILSFGCSTGEEVFSLSSYFPEAKIKGIDINRHAIKKCQSHLAKTGGNSRITFQCAGDAFDELPESYDAVFAMAVFRHGDLNSAPDRCEHLIRFAAFEDTVDGLSRCLKPGGLLVIRHANFRFTDTKTAAGFRLLLAAKKQRPDQMSPLYGQDDKLLKSQEPDDGVYCKL